NQASTLRDRIPTADAESPRTAERRPGSLPLVAPLRYCPAVPITVRSRTNVADHLPPRCARHRAITPEVAHRVPPPGVRELTPPSNGRPPALARHRSPGGQAPSPALEDALDGVDDSMVRPRGAHRLPAPSSALRGRVMVAAVAAGAFAAAAA